MSANPPEALTPGGHTRLIHQMPTAIEGLLTVQQAIGILDAAPVAPRILSVPLHEALGLVLAEDIRSDRPYPPFDRSLMDGYAVRCADMAGPPVTLRVVGEIAAGQSPSSPLNPGQAVAIMTGAPLPPGADGVVPVEEVIVGADTIRIDRAIPAQRYVSRAGSDMPPGQVVLTAGTRLESPQLAAAAAVGATTIRAFAAPRVAILATGDEVVPPDHSPGPAQIRNSNSIMLAALLHRLGCRAVDLGLVPDRPELLRAALLKGLQLDALMVTGGMSMGRHDHVPRLLAELGADLRITRLRIKPGKPFVFGQADRSTVFANQCAEPLQCPAEGTCHVFGLPGNPVSAFVCAVRLAARLLARLAGACHREQLLHARLSADLSPNGPREFYQPAQLRQTADGPIVHPLEWRGSADVFTLAQATALIVRPENEPARATGTLATVLPI